MNIAKILNGYLITLELRGTKPFKVLTIFGVKEHLDNKQRLRRYGEVLVKLNK